MMNCRHATRLLSDGLERSLSLGERLGLGVHLLGCRPCRRFRQATRWLHRALAAPPDVALPDEARDRIRRALEHAAGNE
jgi:hypothetical protein